MAASISVPRAAVWPPQSVLYRLSFNAEDVLGCMPPPLLGIHANPTMLLLFPIVQTLLVSLGIRVTLHIPLQDLLKMCTPSLL
jgi:hypothetical protein